MAEIADLKSIAHNAAREGGVSEVTASVNSTDQSQLVTMPMTEEELGDWRQKIQASDDRINDLWEREWKILLQEYTPIVVASGTPESIKVNAHFRNIHSKIGQLFLRSPEIRLEPEPSGPAFDAIPNPMDPMTPYRIEDIVAIRQQVLNKKLGRDGIKANRLYDEMLFDVLGWAGIGVCKVGYTAVIKEVQEPVMGLDPNAMPPQQPGAVLGLGAQPQPAQVPQIDPATGQPMTRKVPVTIFEECYARRVSPRKLISDQELHSTRFQEDSTFIGHHFYMSPAQAMKVLKLTEEEVGKSVPDDKTTQAAERRGKKDVPRVHGMELFVKGSFYVDGELHPQAIYQLILVEGVDRPVVWRPSVDQTFDERGKLTQDSLIGFPLQVLTIRDFGDEPFTKSDSAFTNSQAKNLNTFRRQNIALRDRAIGKYAYDLEAVGDEALNQIKNGDVGEYIGFKPGVMAQGLDKVLALTAQVRAPVNDMASAAQIKEDMNETLGIDSNAAGAPTSNVISATEVATIRAAVSARAEKEQGRVIDHYLDIARMVDTLSMRYTTEDQYELMVGADNTQRIMVWNGRIMNGKWIYSIAPDSQLRVDTAQDRQQNLTFYNLTARDPLVDRSVIIKRLGRQFSYDPKTLLINPALLAAQPQHGGGEVNQHESAKSGGKESAPGQTGPTGG